MPDPTLEFHPEADKKAASAADWYAERSPSAAEAFLGELDHAMEQIADAPDRWARYLHGTRRYLMKRFPFLVVYREQSPDTIQMSLSHTVIGGRATGVSELKIGLCSFPLAPEVAPGLACFRG